MEILIAEDDRITQELLMSILKSYGTCTLVDNGSKVIDRFKQKLETGQNYDLVCLDIMMPNIDGISALKELRYLEKSYKVETEAKILMITALDNQSLVFESYMGGATGYIVKPIIKQAVDEELSKFGLI